MTDPGKPSLPDDHVADLLQQALTEEAETVRPDPSALQRIRERTDRGGRRPALGTPARGRLRVTLAVVGAAAVTAGVVVGGVAMFGPGATPRTPVAAQTKHPGVFHPAAPWSADITYLGPSNPTVRLYVERHDVRGPSRLAAVHEFLTSTPIDPSYRSGWPAGVDCRSITTGNRVTRFSLTGTANLSVPNGLSPDEAQLAIQALLRTAGGVHAASFSYNGKPLKQLLGVNVAKPVTLLPDSSVRALVNITNISDHQTITDPVTVRGTGNVFEANLNWQLLRGGHRVNQGYTSTGTLDSWRPFEIRLGNLQPGTYTIRCFEYSPANGSRQFTDDKTFTVR